MKVLQIVLVFSILFGLNSCIKEDIVDDQIEESIRINNSFSNFTVGETIVLDAFFFDNLGMKQTVVFDLKSNNPSIVEIENSTQKIIAKSKGTTTIVVSAVYNGKQIENTATITVIESGTPPDPNNVIKIGTLVKTSSYASAGDFEITAITGGIRIQFASNYVADQNLPGFAMYLTNNPNSRTGAIKIDAQGDADGVIYKGAFTMDVMGVGINDFGYLTHWCDPFSIKVGEAQIKNK
ncbi:hypothetical protein SLW70_11950 [Flavobacterium sp. NG2]|uniref:hypothetical protein n=1 Tax=Flavobacterium sp. NG2 TaxID=3097547 RepID=UPI002A7F25A5|nr:hypothetical protein [Flavobacterium sp. NG2]WPR70644.1 hypothetical protein SLW70_11950 [Flavobacterium sp. NG2]